MALTISVETITPEEADRLLTKNHSNRRLRPRWVQAYARDMKAGRWRMTGEAVKLDAKENILDGLSREIRASGRCRRSSPCSHTVAGS